MARKKKPDEGSSGAYWMDTYGDMITLVLTFFVLLFSMSTIDKAKWEMLVSTMTGTPMAVVAPLNPGRSVAPDPSMANPEVYTPEQLEKMEQEQESKDQFADMLEKINALIEEKNLQSSLLVEAGEDEITLRFVDSLLFDSGKYDLRSDSLEVVQGVMSLIKATEKWIEIVNIAGHTDNIPISQGMIRNNWDLSVMRSCTVLRYFDEIGEIDRLKLSAQGRGETMPIDTNTTQEGRARNRRVDVVISRYMIEVDPVPASEAADQSSPRTEELWDGGL